MPTPLSIPNENIIDLISTYGTHLEILTKYISTNNIFEVTNGIKNETNELRNIMKKLI